MSYLPIIQQHHSSPKELEEAYQAALRQGDAEAFAADLLACHQEAPENLLYAAWAQRFSQLVPTATRTRSTARNWKLAVLLAALTGLTFWGLTSPSLVRNIEIPFIVKYWAPIATLFALIFFAFATRQKRRHVLLIAAALVLISGYVYLITPQVAERYRSDYAKLMLLHLPMLCWISLGIGLLGWKSAAVERFAFLIKSIEVMITAGLYLMAGMAFGGITMALFQTLNITLSEALVRLMAAGGAGLIPLVAVVSVYDPSLTPGEQDFTQGLSRLIATLMRLLLPLTLGVLVVYILSIPFNFMAPFNNRSLLIVYNVMLFAIMGLLVGATPLAEEALSPRLQRALRSGILAVILLALLVSLYALSAILFRTAQGGMTINRLAVVGWNSVNICLLGVMAFRLLSKGQQSWSERMKATFSTGTSAYLAWTMVMILVSPWLFR